MVVNVSKIVGKDITRSCLKSPIPVRFRIKIILTTASVNLVMKIVLLASTHLPSVCHVLKDRCFIVDHVLKYVLMLLSVIMGNASVANQLVYPVKIKPLARCV